jgi:glyoxylate carboligase
MDRIRPARTADLEAVSRLLEASYSNLLGFGGFLCRDTSRRDQAFVEIGGVPVQVVAMEGPIGAADDDARPGRA